jgi:AbrB family looped-hinge helix DNA binding protein
MFVKVSPKYQVVIPEAVRNSLNLRPGMQVEVIAKGGVAYIVPMKTLDEIQQLFSGSVSKEQKRDLINSLREKKDRRV